jgi:hypothetical protein
MVLCFGDLTSTGNVVPGTCSFTYELPTRHNVSSSCSRFFVGHIALHMALSFSVPLLSMLSACNIVSCW